MNDGLLCECRMPLVWREATPDESAREVMMREAALLLAAINQMEGSHELESAGAGESRRLERMEAKLDLALHLLARALDTAPSPPGHAIKLGAEGAEWDDDAPPLEGTALVLELRPSESLPLTLKLPAVALAPMPGLARVRLAELTDALNDALMQFVFRRHRQAIRARAG
jgi:hypothetical protein